MDSQQAPVAIAEMLIRRPAAEVYEAFVDPEITSKFWFTHGSGRLDGGGAIRWQWRMYGIFNAGGRQGNCQQRMDRDRLERTADHS
jgi:uncharacterized protein YndB with AHSA1/START domain